MSSKTLLSVGAGILFLIGICLLGYASLTLSVQRRPAGVAAGSDLDWGSGLWGTLPRRWRRIGLRRHARSEDRGHSAGNDES